MDANEINKRWEVLLSGQTIRERSPISPFDGRTPFENDYSRLISSSFIRRLQDKTQVFPLSDSDFIRTRLTHSLEVSSIARSIGKSVEKKLIKEGLMSSELDGYLSSLLMTTGLIHDLGNPPFGHFGEHSIQKFFQENPEHLKDFNQQEVRDLTFFDGNVQTLRILLKLHYLGDEYSYNLTLPTLATIIKYPRNSIDGNRDKKQTRISEKKFGYFITEQSLYYDIDSRLQLNGERHPATFLLEASDDIAYSAADIEDGVKLGIIDFEFIRTTFVKRLSDKHEVITELDKYYKIFENTGKDRLILTVQRFRIKTQFLLIQSILNEFHNNLQSILNGQYKDELLLKCDQMEIRESYKEIAYEVFRSPIILEPEMAGNEVLNCLLKAFVTAAKSPEFKKTGNNTNSRLYNLIASNYRFVYENYSHKSNSNDAYNRIQLILDFLSSMTDGYALSLYQKLKGINL